MRFTAPFENVVAALRRVMAKIPKKQANPESARSA
jgi:hypothetical protein